jgi:hypothetical protein
MGAELDRQAKIELMLRHARQMAGEGHYPPAIQAVLVAEGFPEADEFIGENNFSRELKSRADQVRQQALKVKL